MCNNRNRKTLRRRVSQPAAAVTPSASEHRVQFVPPPPTAAPLAAQFTHTPIDGRRRGRPAPLTAKAGGGAARSPERRNRVTADPGSCQHRRARAGTDSRHSRQSGSSRTQQEGHQGRTEHRANVPLNWRDAHWTHSLENNYRCHASPVYGRVSKHSKERCNRRGAYELQDHHNTQSTDYI